MQQELEVPLPVAHLDYTETRPKEENVISGKSSP